MKDSKPLKNLVVTCNHCDLVMEKVNDGYVCRTNGCGKGSIEGKGKFAIEEDEDGNVSITTG